jgi:ribosomal protein S12 methylthiotransferase
VGRHAQQAPEIDGLTYVNEGMAYPGELVTLEVTDASDYDLIGRVVARDPSRPPPRPRDRTPKAPPETRKGRLKVIP